MVQSMVSKGKDIEEAIESALTVMEKDRKQVDIEVIDSGKKRMLWSRPAVVKVTYSTEEKKGKSISPSEEDWLDNMEQMRQYQPSQKAPAPPVETEVSSEAWITDGKIFYNHSGEKDFPTVTPGDHVAIIRNGEEVKGTALVEPGDVFTTRVEEHKEETFWKVKIDAKKMKAHLKLQVGRIWKYEVIDQKPVRNLEVTAKQIELIENALTKKDVYQWLEENIVTDGILHYTIEEAINAETDQEFMIAEGVAPTRGANGNVEFYIDTTAEKVEYREKENGTVDFKNARRFSNVSRGEMIGKVIDAVPGEPGVNIHGEKIPPPPVHEAKLRLDKSVQLVEPDQLVSLAEGRLDVERRGVLCKVKVVPKLYVNRNVDVKYGNVDYYGDVEVRGSVLEFMEVKAKGEVQVHGSVHFSKINTARSIYCGRNVIQSNLSSGERTFTVQELTDDLETVLSGLGKCIAAAEQLAGVSAFSNKDLSEKGLSSLIRLLMEKKLSWVRQAMLRYVAKVKKHRDTLDEEWIVIQERIEKGFVLYHPDSFKSITAIQEFEEYIREWLEATDGEVTESGNRIVIPYALKSQIYSSGDIMIKGQGCYNSKLHAGRNIEVTGVVRGGYLFAEEGLHLFEAGLEGGGVSVVLGTSETGEVKIDTVYEDTIVLVGTKRHVFMKTMHDVRARLDEEGELLLF
ncbi:FapA family protein [Salimicrobium flavidum]|nr:FapA family protein [Salimicrobium flavidum]